MKLKNTILFACACPLLFGCNITKYVGVTFDFRNGQDNQTEKIAVGAKLKKLADPIKKNCKFDRWECDDYEWDFDLNSVNKDSTLIARYKRDDTKMGQSEVEPSKKHDNANFRVMSFNVLTAKYNNNPRHKGYNARNEVDENAWRDRDMLDTIEEYEPDIVGLQELDYVAYNYIIEHSSKYVFVNADLIVDPANPREEGEEPAVGTSDSNYYNAIFSTIAYNKNTVELDGEYEIKYHGANSDNHDCRYLTMACFKHKNTNKKIVATSTHWNLSSLTKKEKDSGMTIADKAAKNLRQANESAEWTFDFARRHGNAPVITTGDYNSRDFRETYQAFLTKTNFQDTKYTSKTKGLLFDTSHIGNGYSKEERVYRGLESIHDKNVNSIYCIDHIFASKSLKPIYYDSITTKKALDCSDHTPIYTDFVI